MARPYVRFDAARFLSVLRSTGIVDRAAYAIGVDRTTAYKRRSGDPNLAAEWDAALADHKRREGTGSGIGGIIADRLFGAAAATL